MATKKELTELEDLLGTIRRSYTPWWHGVTPHGRTGFEVEYDILDGMEGNNLGRIVITPRKARDAMTAAALNGQLCCVADMTAYGLGYSCAEDVDVILQTAIFGKLVFG